MWFEPPVESAAEVRVNSHQTPALAAYTRCDCPEWPVASANDPAIWLPTLIGALGAAPAAMPAVLSTCTSDVEVTTAARAAASAINSGRRLRIIVQFSRQTGCQAPNGRSR